MGGTAIMLVFSGANPDPWRGPRRISQDHARRMWTAAGWRVDSITPAEFADSLSAMVSRLAILMLATRIA